VHRAVVLALVAACGAGGTPVAPPIAAEQGCDRVTSYRRVTVERDRPLALTGGERIVYRGDADRMRLHFELIGATGSTPWRPDRRGSDHERIGGYCLRVIGGTRMSVEIELPSDSLPPTASGECKLACCTTPESRTPAPDGSVECCFCSP
jgi:hypothetical protein